MKREYRYSRVYWEVIDDPKFADIFDSDAHLATWLRLLIFADMAWPASAQLPMNTNRKSLDKLVAVGLVQLLAGARYRVTGMDAERNKREQERLNGGVVRASNAQRGADGRFLPEPEVDTSAGTSAGDQRWSPAGPANTRRDETSIDETRTARPDLEAWLLVRRRPPTTAQRQFLDGYQRTFDVTGPARAERLILANPDDPIAAMKADLDSYRQERMAAATQAEAEAAERAKTKRRGFRPGTPEYEMVQLLTKEGAA